MSLDKGDFKEMGIPTMGRRMDLMADIHELLQREKGDVVRTSTSTATTIKRNYLIIAIIKRKIKILDKEKWDAKTKTKLP